MNGSASSEYQNKYAQECRPLKTIGELLNFHQFSITWHKLVEPLIPIRSKPRFLSDDFESISFEIKHHQATTVLTTPTNEDVDRSMDEQRRNYNEQIGERPEVLVCHDLGGNYRGDRFVNGSKKWDDYRFYHWSGIDYFCYFGHDFITIPTLQWINAAHRNGVKCIGTFIVEFSHGSAILEDILESEERMRTVADAMVFITKYLKFEGWLLNVECDLAMDKIPLLHKFVEYITKRTHEEIPNGKIFWYDSIIRSGQLQWQNELNTRNELFFDVCDGILINYTWTERNLQHCVELASGKNRKKDVFIGLDVFGRGQLAKFHSNKTVAKIEHRNLSIGIFAPGWTFEAMQLFGINIGTVNGTELCNSQFLERNDLYWKLLWKYFYTCGPSHLPFYTSFCMGSGKRLYQDGFVAKNGPWFNLSEQQWQPSVPSGYRRYFDDSYNGGSCLKISPTSTNIRLFVCDFSLENGILFAYAYKCPKIVSDLAIILSATTTTNTTTTTTTTTNRNGAVIDQSHNNTNQYQLICKANTDNHFEFGDERYQRMIFNNLTGNELKIKLIQLSELNEKLFPTTVPMDNGWKIRYHHIFLEELRSARITDIGVTVKNSSRNTDENYLLLGAIHIHQSTINRI